MATVNNPYLEPITDPNIPKQATVAGQMEGLLAKGGPYMQQARTQALQGMHARGLINTNMALQAGEAAARQSALPIATSDASAALQSYLSGQSYGQNLGLVQSEYGERGNLAELQSDLALKQQGYTLSGNLQGKFSDQLAQIQTNASDSIQAVMTAQDIDASTKDTMISDIVARRDADLQFMNAVYGALPAWQTGFTITPGETPPPPISVEGGIAPG